MQQRDFARKFSVIMWMGGWVGGWGDSNPWFLKPPRSSRLNLPRFTAFGNIIKFVEKNKFMR